MTRCAEVDIQDKVCSLRALALHEIHQEKSEVIEHIAGAHECIELQRVERNRAAVDQCDVAEMQIAMAAPNKSFSTPCEQQGANARKRRAASRRERRDRARVEQIGLFA